MALTGKKYEKFYSTTGSGEDKVKTETLTKAEAFWDADRASGFKDLLNDLTLGPLVFQLQQMQDELDYLRTEISANKDKTGITSQQTNAITANEKAVASNTSDISGITSDVKGLTSDMKAVQQNLTVSTDSGIEAKFENLKAGLKGATIDLKITDNNGKSPKSYKATIILQ